MKKLRSQIRVTEIDGFSDSLIRNFKADAKAQADAFLKSLMDELESLSGQITVAILQDKIVSTLDSADDARDEAIRTLGTMLAAYSVFPIESKRESAAPLKAVYDKYAKAGIVTANYNSESSMIESMLQDFASENLSESIKSLDGVAEAIAAIRSAQDAFTKANDDYVKASTNKSDSASSFKKPIVLLVNERLIPYLDAMTIAKNENCQNFTKSVEAEISRANEAVAKRTKKPAVEG